MNLKEMLNQVLAQSGFIERSQFAASTDVDDKQMVAIANRVRQEIVDHYNWNELRNDHTIPLQDGVTIYNMPEDFRGYVPDSGWQKDGSRPIELPVPDGRWYQYVNSAHSDAGTWRCRVFGNQIEVYDAKAGDEIVLFYMSGWAVVDQDTSRKERFNNDNDSWLLDDQLLILGVQAHWADTKLLPQSNAWMTNYRMKLNEAIGRSAGGRVIGGRMSRNKYPNNPPYTPTYVK